MVGMAYEIGYPKVIVHRTTTNAYRVQGDSGGKSYVSLLFCAPVTRSLPPLFIIYKANRMFGGWCVGGLFVYRCCSDDRYRYSLLNVRSDPSYFNKF